jgi:hypothetical protein
MLDLEEILISLYASAINVSISWIWDGDIDVKLGDPLNGYKVEGKVATVTEVADWLAIRPSDITRAASSRRSSGRVEPPYNRTDQPVAPIEHGRFGAIPSSPLGGIGLAMI